MKKQIDRILEWVNGSPLLELAARLCLGAVFLYASIHKITDPASFAKIIYGYGLVPKDTINIMAILLPYVEFFTGLFLVTGVYPRSAAVIAEFLLLVFIVAISINLIRGHSFDCGCFSFEKGNQDSGGLELLVRDVIWFSVGMVVLMYRSRRKFSLTG